MKNFDKEFSIILEKKLKALDTLDDTVDVGDAASDEAALADTFEDPDTIDLLKTRMATKSQNIVDDSNLNHQVQTVTMKEKLLEWVDIMQAFTEFLNGNDPHSIQYIVANAPAGSLFEKVRISEGKKISRAAVDLSALREALKSYIVSNPNTSK